MTCLLQLTQRRFGRNDDEARHSLSLLSSFLGLTRHLEKRRSDADTAAVPVELKIFRGSENKHAFQPLVWGSIVTPRLIEEPAGARKEKGNGEAGEGKTETAHFSAKWSALNRCSTSKVRDRKCARDWVFREGKSVEPSGFIPPLSERARLKNTNSDSPSHYLLKRVALRRLRTRAAPRKMGSGARWWWGGAPGKRAESNA